MGYSLTGVEKNSFVCDMCNFKTNTQHSLRSHKQKIDEELSLDFPYLCNNLKAEIMNNDQDSSKLAESNFQTSADSSQYLKHEPAVIFVKPEEVYIKEEPINHDDDAEVAGKTEPFDSKLNKKKFAAVSVEVTATGKKVFKCNFCGYSNTDKRVLWGHMNRHSNDRPYKCTICNGAFKRPEGLKYHLEHNVHMKTKTIYECDECDYKVSNKKKFNSHVARHTKDKKLHKCINCDFVTPSKNSLTNHMRTHDENNKLTCNECNFTAVSHRSLVVHKNNHNKKLLKCDVCDYEDSSKIGLLNHKRTHIGSKRVKVYFCDICMYNAGNKTDLDKHKNAHAAGRCYRCDLCDFSTKNINLLVPHMKSHVT